MRAALQRVRSGGDRGLTLIELLVAMTLFLVLSAVAFTTVTTAASSVRNTRKVNDLNEQARLVLTRIAREVREANRITAVNSDPSLGLTFEVDFDGDGLIEPTASDAEVLHYEYDGANKRLLLTASTGGPPTTLPVLASNVEAFSLEYRSRLYQYDASGDGVTTWQELDGRTLTNDEKIRRIADGVGDVNGSLTAPELAHVDSIIISFTVLKDERTQVYRTQIDLRNRG